MDAGFNLVNTITYAVIAIVALIGLYKMFKKLDIAIDDHFLYSLIPFIILAAITRSFIDHKFFGEHILINYFLTSPGIYISTALLFILFFGIGYKLKGKEYWKVSILLTSIIIIVNILINITKIQLHNLHLAGIILVIVAAIFISIYLTKYFKDKYSLAAIASQIFDGTTTAVILAFTNGVEKHPIPRLLVENLGPWSFLLVKVLLILGIVYYINKEKSEYKNYFLSAIIILGFAEGLRNLISLII